MLSERFGRGSVSDRSAAADAVRAFVVPFNSVSVVPARPAMGFRVLPAAPPPLPSGRGGLRPAWIGQDVLGEVLVHRWRQKVRSAGMAPAGKPWTPGNGAGRPSERDAGRPATPAGTRMASGHDNPSRLKMTPIPGAGQPADSPPPRSPSGHPDSKAGRPQPKPGPSCSHKIWRLHPKREAAQIAPGAFSSNHHSRRNLQKQRFSATLRISTVRETRRTP